MIRLDNQADHQSDADYDQTLAYIRDHLMQFYQEYAADNQLSIEQVQGRVSKWDLQQWQQAIDELNTADWPSEATKRLTAYGAVAGIDKPHLIGAIVSVGLLALTVKHQKQIAKRVKSDGQDEVSRMTKTFKLKPKQVKKATSVITQPSTTAQWSSKLWLNSDAMANDVENLVNKHLRHGMSLSDLQDMLVKHTNPDQFKPNQSIADRVRQSQSNAQRLIRTESARLVDSVNMSTYRMQGVKLVAWINEPGACNLCQGLADGGPYAIDDAPLIPGDSHPNCRCSKIPAGYDKLPDSQIMAVNQYLSSNSYLINDTLSRSSELTPTMQVTVDNLDQALKTFPKYNGEIFRSMDATMLKTPMDEFLQKYAPSSVVKEPAYTSFATNIYAPNARIQMHIRHAKNPRDLRSLNPEEHEVLYERNAQFKVVARKMDQAGRILLQMEEYDE